MLNLESPIGEGLVNSSPKAMVDKIQGCKRLEGDFFHLENQLIFVVTVN